MLFSWVISFLCCGEVPGIDTFYFTSVMLFQDPVDLSDDLLRLRRRKSVLCDQLVIKLLDLSVLHAFLSLLLLRREKRGQGFIF